MLNVSLQLEGKASAFMQQLCCYLIVNQVILIYNE